MADYDLKNNVKFVDAVAFASYTTDQASAALDTMGFKGVLLKAKVGIGGITFDASNKIELKLTHSDDDVTYVGVTDDEVQLDIVAGAGRSDLVVGTGGIVKSFIAAHAALKFYSIGYRGKKQYVKATFDFTGTHGSGTPLGAEWVLHNPVFRPVNQGDYDDSHAINL